MKEASMQLEQMMVKAFNDVYESSKRQKVDIRVAALILGVGRVAEAVKILDFCLPGM